MTNQCDMVYDCLKKLKGELRPLTIFDFAALGLSGNTMAECLRYFEAQGIIRMPVIPHRTSRDSTGVDQVIVYITDQGREEFED